MRLAHYIESNAQRISQEWEAFAHALSPDMSHLGLRDHIDDILEFITKNIIEPQTKQEQLEKSQGVKKPGLQNAVANAHADWRLVGGFSMDQMVLEYRALRASIIKLWCEQIEMSNTDDMSDMIRFNEAIDQLMSESITYYTAKIRSARQMFLGILGHDLLTPLGAIKSSAEIIQRIGVLDATQKEFASLMVESADRAAAMAMNLMDLTQVGLGTGLTVNRDFMDIAFVGEALVHESRAYHPRRIITLEVKGDTKGHWDKLRTGQIFSNLIGNALQYGTSNKPILVRIDGGAPKFIELSVHNEGNPIPHAGIESLFDSFTRGGSDDTNDRSTKNLGLGLYITKEIVAAHEGTIDVKSSETGGTTFIVRLPRDAGASKLAA